VRAKVSDDIGVVKVELFVDGKLYATKGAQYHDFPVSLQPGVHTLRVVGHDGATKKGAALLQIKVISNATGSPPPPPNQPPAGTFGYGMTCSSGNQCNSGICANDLSLNQQYCTQTCDPVGVACPTGSDCYSTSGGSHVCAPLLDANAGGAGSAKPEAVGAGMSCSVAAGGVLQRRLRGLLVRSLPPNRSEANASLFRTAPSRRSSCTARSGTARPWDRQAPRRACRTGRRSRPCWCREPCWCRAPTPAL